MSQPFPFKIGADPEFQIYHQQKEIDARKFLTSLLSKEKKEATNDLGFNYLTAGQLGWDGCNTTGEIRPLPDNNIDRVVANIRKLFEKIAEKTKLIDLKTQNFHNPIGGHIHLEMPDIPSPIISDPPPESEEEETIPPNSDFIISPNSRNRNTSEEHKISEIHKMVSSLFLPLIAGEDNKHTTARLNNGYGKLTDFRYETRKGKMVYEFRTPSAEWLTTPKTAKATLAYVATVFNEANFHPKELKKKLSEIIWKNEAEGRMVGNLTTMKYLKLGETIGKTIKKEIKNFEFYPHFKEEINFILDPKKVMKEKIKYDFDIMKGWKLEDKRTPNKRSLLNRKLMIEKSKTMDLEYLGQMINLNFNPDDYISDFTRELRNIIIAFNWKLKNNYYFFGERKGISKYTAMTLNGDFITGQEQLETTGDYLSILELFGRMANRNNWEIMKRTQTKKKENDKTILIGIPYQERIETKIKDFTNFIWKIETNKLTERKNFYDLYSELRAKEITVNPENDPNFSGPIYEILKGDRSNSNENSLLNDIKRIYLNN